MEKKHNSSIILPGSYPFKKEIYEGVEKDWFPIFVRYPVNPKPRYSHENPNPFLYTAIEKNRISFLETLNSFKKYSNKLRQIKYEQKDSKNPSPFWNNPWFSGLDATALYAFIAEKKPKKYLEIGSGNSTKFSKKAILDFNLETKIISIDPQPREEIDSLSDQIIRKPLEEIDIGILETLTSNDIIFFDGSHRCFMNSDVTVFFLDVLPRLPSGIFIHIHDIHLPYDYQFERRLHYESEQYLLAIMLLNKNPDYEIVLPCRFVIQDNELSNSSNWLWDIAPKRGTSFWLKKK